MRLAGLTALLALAGCEGPEPRRAETPPAPPPQSAPPFAAPETPATPQMTPPVAGAPATDPIQPRERVGT
ncbi:MAG: hypothetical protein KY446_03700 [Proteobacteria bacterium]|nr:hypothetical protein [Pseudomonadota bacterium]MBW3616846.1 hypothetical protein [Pseudomonadota bacterium]